MKIRPNFFALLLMLTLVACSSGCSKKIATDDNYYNAGTLRLTPAQSGKNLKAAYSNSLSGIGIICNVTMELLHPGDSGTITWTLKNIDNQDGSLTVKANVASFSPTSSVGGPTLDYIGVKLRNDNVYLLGDDSNYVPLGTLAAVLIAQAGSLPGGGETAYEIQWQVAANPSQAGPDGKFGTADDVPVGSDTVGQDKTVVDVTFSLLNSDWNE
jgi:hypothetical protein